MNTIFVYGDQYEDRIIAWILSDEISYKYFYKGTWKRFTHTIDKVCNMITSFKPGRIVFHEHSGYEDAIWDAVTSKCDNELEITIEHDGKIIFR